VDYALVGRCAEPEKSNSIIRNLGYVVFNHLFRIENFYLAMFRRLLILLPLIFILSQCNKPEKKEPVVRKEINELPYLTFNNLDGTNATTRDLPGASILILFNADCDHCQREAKSIQEKLNSFKGYTLQFIASDPVEIIQKFSRDYQLDNQPNVRFGRAEGVDVYTNFGSIPTPSIYIYSKEKRFVKSFLGETPVDEIINFL
jgi:hypothetical protein